jgi:hypothetical protein
VKTQLWYCPPCRVLPGIMKGVNGWDQTKTIVRSVAKTNLNDIVNLTCKL